MIWVIIVTAYDVVILTLIVNHVGRTEGISDVRTHARERVGRHNTPNPPVWFAAHDAAAQVSGFAFPAGAAALTSSWPRRAEEVSRRRPWLQSETSFKIERT